MDSKNYVSSDSKNYFIPKYIWRPEGLSFIDQLKGKSLDYRKAFLNTLSEDEIKNLGYCWQLWARENQLPPPKDIVDHYLGWKYWVVLAGRGFGKTRLAAEYVRYRIEKGLSKRIALIGPTYRDVLQTMIKGESGLQSVFPKNWTLKLNRSDGTITFFKNNIEMAKGFIYTGEEPERLRGPQHDFAWIDELAAFKYIEEVWSLFVPGLRLGKAQAIFTTTPKASLLKISLLNDERVVCTFGKSSENKSNLSDGWLESIENVYEDTDAGDSELEGKLPLDENGSLFKQNWINENRIHGNLIYNEGTKTFAIKPKDSDEISLTKIIVSIDPSGSSKDSTCECGLTLAGMGSDGYGYAIEDLTKPNTSPMDWAKIAIDNSIKFGLCEIVYEKNFGDQIVGDLLRKTAKEMNVKVSIRGICAQKDKYQRAIPISALCQKGRIKFLGNKFHKLEKQMTTWLPGDKSPDRMDAFVWAMIVLLDKQTVRGNIATNLFSF